MTIQHRRKAGAFIAGELAAAEWGLNTVSGRWSYSADGATINTLDTDLVTSVFGRLGIVVAEVGDYEASQVTNDSDVVGGTVADALDTLLADKADEADLSAEEAAREAADLALQAAIDAILEEATTATSLGAGSHVFKTQVGNELRFRSLTAGANITLTQNADDIQIAFTPSAFTPTAHAASHGDGGSDEVTINASQVTAGTFGAGNFIYPDNVIVTGAASASRGFRYQVGGLDRIVTRLATAETGGETGSNWALVTFNDAGASTATAVFVVRATRVVGLSAGMRITSAALNEANLALATGTLLDLSYGTGVDPITPVTLRLHSLANTGTWNIVDPWANLDFVSDDVTGAGAGTRARIGAYMGINTGAHTGLKFYVAENAGLFEALRIESGTGTFIVFSRSAASNQAFQIVLPTEAVNNFIRISGSTNEVTSGTTTFGELRWTITDATPDPLKTKLDFSINAGDSAVIQLTLTSGVANFPVAGHVIQIAGTQVLGPRKTGWAAATGTAERTTYATYTAPAISNPPTQAEVQAIADHVQILSRRFKGLTDDGISLGFIGA